MFKALSFSLAVFAAMTIAHAQQAGDAAPWGKGMESLEAVIHDKGFEHLRKLMTLAAGARPEAQKRGPACGAAPAAARRSSRRAG